MVDYAPPEFLDAGVLARLAAIPLVARLPMQGSVSGRHRSPHRGSSVEFSEYRKYVPGDDPRRLDWRTYARTDRFYVKEFEAETNLRLVLVLDGSGSMRAGSGHVTKIEYARSVAGTLGYLALSQGDAVGLTVMRAHDDVEIPPSRRPSHLVHVNEAIADIDPEGAADLARSLHDVAERNRQRALVVIISDLFVPVQPLEGALQHLQFRKHDVAVFQLLDPQEVSFDLRGTVRFLDLEGGAPVVADAPSISRRYEAAFSRHRDALEVTCQKSAVDFRTVQIDRPYEEVVVEFLVGRAQSGLRS